MCAHVFLVPLVMYQCDEVLNAAFSLNVQSIKFKEKLFLHTGTSAVWVKEEQNEILICFFVAVVYFAAENKK